MQNDDQQQLAQLLCHGDIESFNQTLRQMKSPSIRDANLCGVDLRKLYTKGLDMRGCHLRRTDLRGLDLSTALLDGASIGGAKISGTLFPRNLSAEEITLSLVHGTRMRSSDGG
ncbi:pentapeptide repeat-containing protein [Thiolapillus sp.]